MEERKGKLVAYVRPGEGTCGPILDATGAMFHEVEVYGWDLFDQQIPAPPAPGLQVFEGSVDLTGAEGRMVGHWRPLTIAEAAALTDPDGHSEEE